MTDTDTDEVCPGLNEPEARSILELINASARRQTSGTAPILLDVIALAALTLGNQVKASALAEAQADLIAHLSRAFLVGAGAKEALYG